MQPSKLGIEQLSDRVVLTAGIGGLVNDVPEPTPVVFSGGWGMAQYQYGFEGTYHNSAQLGQANNLKGNVTDPTPIVFIGGYGAASYQYANETTYDAPATGDISFAHLVQKQPGTQIGTANGGIWKTTNF